MSSPASDSDPKVPAPPDGEVIGYAAAARALAVNINTLYAWVHQKRIPHIRYGRRNVRFRRSELLAYVEAHSVAATGGSDE
jgi:excisionase family DNA binding protein